jgi:hypothetical protein
MRTAPTPATVSAMSFMALSSPAPHLRMAREDLLDQGRARALPMTRSADGSPSRALREQCRRERLFDPLEQAERGRLVVGNLCALARMAWTRSRTNGRAP